MDNTNEFSFVLKPSSIPNAGIGVFSTHDIKKGTRLYLHTDNHVSRELSKNDIPIELLKLCIAKENDKYICPEHFNRVEMGWYVNHSNKPNIEKKDDGFYAIRDIHKSEELVMNYNQLYEPNSKKEYFYT